MHQFYWWRFLSFKGRHSVFFFNHQHSKQATCSLLVIVFLPELVYIWNTSSAVSFYERSKIELPVWVAGAWGATVVPQVIPSLVQSTMEPVRQVVPLTNHGQEF